MYINEIDEIQMSSNATDSMSLPNTVDNSMQLL